jgi:hypothetical protein
LQEKAIQIALLLAEKIYSGKDDDKELPADEIPEENLTVADTLTPELLRKSGETVIETAPVVVKRKTAIFKKSDISENVIDKIPRDLALRTFLDNQSLDRILLLWKVFTFSSYGNFRLISDISSHEIAMSCLNIVLRIFLEFQENCTQVLKEGIETTIYECFLPVFLEHTKTSE